jgi:hypothetical protein
VIPTTYGSTRLRPVMRSRPRSKLTNWGTLRASGDRYVQAIGKGEAGARVKGEGATEPTLARQGNSRQLQQRQDIVADQRPRVLVEALEGEDRLEDDRGGRLDPKSAVLYAVEVKGYTGRVVGVVLQEVSQEDVGVEKGRAATYPSDDRAFSSATPCSKAARSSAIVWPGADTRSALAVRAVTLSAGRASSAV